MIFRELIGGKFSWDAPGIIIWYIVYVGPWVFGWKSLKTSRKTLRCGCMGLILPLGMSPKRHRVWLALGWCPRIVILYWSSVLWSIDICCVDCWESVIYQLWKDGWGKARMKPANTCIHVSHDYTFVMVIKCLSCMILNV